MTELERYLRELADDAEIDECRGDAFCDCALCTADELTSRELDYMRRVPQ
jgi:hypothetical protein